MSSLFDLSGKVAIITGASKGIGKAIANRFAEHGAKVVISSRKLDACKATAEEINSQWGKGTEVAHAVSCNITHREDLSTLVEETRAKWGRIDILVCNAAVNPYFGPMLDCPEEAYDKIMNGNLKSIFLLTNMVVPEMIERRDGSIIIVSSIGALRGSARLGIYGITKAAEVQMARNLAMEHGPHNIRANAILPGLIQTDFSKALWDNPEILKVSTEISALKRIGQPDEIAGAAVYLASAASGFTTGQTIIIDGGRMVAGN